MSDTTPLSVPRGRVVPDFTKYVFTCLAPDCSWQLQASRRARLSLGSALELHKAIAQAAADHQVAEHAGWVPDLNMAAGQQATGGLMAQPLPRWWVER